MNVHQPSARAKAALEILQRQTMEETDLRPNFDPDPYSHFLMVNRRTYPDYSDSKIKALHDEHLRDWEAARATVPTKHQDVGEHIIISQIERQIKAAAGDGLLFSLPEGLLIGSLPSGQVQALTVPVPGSQDILVLVNRGLFFFMNEAAKVVARLLPRQRIDDKISWDFSDYDAMDVNLALDPIASEAFSHLVCSYAVDGYPASTFGHFFDPDVGQIVATLRHSAETFVIAHEYGHIIAGHKLDTSPVVQIPGATNADARAHTWTQESEADEFGALITYASLLRARNSDRGLNIAGIGLCLIGMDVISRAVSLLAHGQEETSSPTHPPCDTRISDLYFRIRVNMGEEMAEHFLSLVKGLRYILLRLWQIVRVDIAVLRAHGQRPQRMWATAP